MNTGKKKITFLIIIQLFGQTCLNMQWHCSASPSTKQHFTYSPTKSKFHTKNFKISHWTHS